MNPLQAMALCGKEPVPATSPALLPATRRALRAEPPQAGNRCGKYLCQTAAFPSREAPCVSLAVVRDGKVPCRGQQVLRGAAGPTPPPLSPSSPGCGASAVPGPPQQQLGGAGCQEAGASPMGPHAACFLPGELRAEAGGRQGMGLVPPEAVGGKDEPLAGRSHTKGGCWRGVVRIWPAGVNRSMGWVQAAAVRPVTGGGWLSSERDLGLVLSPNKPGTPKSFL